MVDAAIALNNHVHGRLIPCNPCKESAAIIARHTPASLERELAEALRGIETSLGWTTIAHADSDNGIWTAIGKARAMLCKYKATHPPTPAHG